MARVRVPLVLVTLVLAACATASETEPLAVSRVPTVQHCDGQRIWAGDCMVPWVDITPIEVRAKPLSPEQMREMDALSEGRGGILDFLRRLLR